MTQISQDRLVSMMGGHIWVESEMGKGSTFHFTAGFDLDPEGEPRASRQDLESEKTLHSAITQRPV